MLVELTSMAPSAFRPSGNAGTVSVYRAYSPYFSGGRSARKAKTGSGPVVLLEMLALTLCPEAYCLF